MAAIATPNATVQTVHQSVPLSDLSLLWRASSGVMIADQIMPVKAVQNENDNYYVWDKNQRFRVLRTDGQGSQRADKTAAKVRDFGFVEASYRTIEYAIAESVSDREKGNADQALSLEQSKILGIQDELMLDYEIRVASIVTNTANYTLGNTVTNSGTSQWNNASFASLNTTGSGHSTIKGQINAARQAIIQNTGGYLPNVIIIPFYVAVVLNNDPGLLDLEKFTINSLINGDLVNPQASLWGMRVVIPTVQYQQTTEGEPSNLSYIWGKNVWLGYVNPSPSLNSLTYGITFRKDSFQVRSWRWEPTRETFYEVLINQTEKLISQECGYLIKNAVA